MRPTLALLFLAGFTFAAEPDFPITEDSKPQANVAKGTMIKDTYHAGEESVFPGTQREYQIYLPAEMDRNKPAAFMVFQDGVIYQAPVAFDNLIAKKDIPPLIGIFIKPGVVPPPNGDANALPRFNRSHEYDSVTDTYSQFLIEEFLPAVEQKHRIKLSQDPNHAAISGNSSGGICAYMVAWHRPDRFRRVFTGVGTYVGIHGADQMPVWLRKHEPKPLRVFLQSGTGDNNLYCGDWWMANQLMERSLAWAGYEVNHAWGEGGHNGKHATQIFPDVLRWLWKDWQTNIEVKANVKGEGKWRGYEVIGAGEWQQVHAERPAANDNEEGPDLEKCRADVSGTVYAYGHATHHLVRIPADGGKPEKISRKEPVGSMFPIPASKALRLVQTENGGGHTLEDEAEHKDPLLFSYHYDLVVTDKSQAFAASLGGLSAFSVKDGRLGPLTDIPGVAEGGPEWLSEVYALCLSPDQTQLYMARNDNVITAAQITPDGALKSGQAYYQLEAGTTASALCVDTNGWLYAATELGIQVCDQAGRVNFIIPTPKPAYGVCFGGKDLSELYIACIDTIYKRPTKAKGIISSQQAPIKPAAPKL